VQGFPHTVRRQPPSRERGAVRVWQPGGHLVRDRSATVEDWSWAQTKRRLSTLYRLARPYRLRTALAILTLLAATAVSLAPPFLVGLSVDAVESGDTTELGVIVSVFVAVGILGVLCSFGQTYFTGWTGERMLADLRNHLFRHLQRLSLGFYERNRAGVLISRLTNDVEALDQLVTDGVTSLVQNTLTLVGSAVILFILDWRLALAVLTVLPALTIATAIFRKRSARSYRRVRETLGTVTATLAEDIAGMRVLQAYTREHAARQQFRRVSEHYRATNQETVVQNALYFPFVDLLSTIATAIVLGYGGWLVFQGEMTIGLLTAFLGYLTNFFDPVQQLSQLYSTFLSAVAALDKIMDVLVQEPEVADRRGATELDRIRGHVRFDGVRFAYGTGPEVLHGIDLDVAAGTTVALVGHTGAGKSTIAKLLARFYDPTEGAITIDGADLREVRQESLRRQLGIVPQEGFLFAGTIAENIAFGRPEASREEIAAAAGAAGADDLVAHLEQGYDTQLGERGFRLSLGQRQLVSFARALLADPRILILDEATSSVDIGTERRIERALRRLLHGRTAFVIAHRLSTIRDADLIVVLEHGVIVEQGTHEELLRRRGRYTELYGSWAAADVA
jgi:ABC-type multidrug transport system fused ATPase/permease subunit